QSPHGPTVENSLYRNHEYGISIENADHTLLRRNRVVNNEKAQLSTVQSDYSSDDSCFANGGPDQLIAALIFLGQYRTLQDYQRGQRQDLSSREGDCGRLPAQADVHKPHEEAKSYTDQARRIQSGAKPSATEASKSSPPEGAVGSW